MDLVGPQLHNKKRSLVYNYNIILNNITLIIWVIMKSMNWDTLKYTIFVRRCLLLLTSTYQNSPHSHSNIKLGKQELS